MPKVSALIVAHNEEEKIEECLKSLVFVDEIVVILDKCTDNTLEIVKKYTKNIIEGEWEIEGVRRNIGLEACDSEWILEIDADERVSKELANEVIDAIKNDKVDSYNIKVNNYVGDRLVKYGWLRTIGVLDKRILSKKGLKKYTQDKKVHPDFKISGNVEYLANSLTHKMDKDITSLISRFNRNTNWRASDMIENKVNCNHSLLKEVISFKIRFFKSFITKKGFKEGSLGFLIAILCALYPLVSRLKAKNRKNENS
ncbi:MAG: glycosyltransferase family 2 protein [Rickettsiales bacterium]|nr:glycosyltransferase family 2 protein [Rickettsiales bacterium]